MEELRSDLNAMNRLDMYDQTLPETMYIVQDNVSGAERLTYQLLILIGRILVLGFKQILVELKRLH